MKRIARSLRFAVTSSTLPETGKPHAHDICHCGDYRYQHDTKGCGICRWDGPTRCEGFNLFERAAPGDTPLAEMHRLTKHLRGGQ